jgi:L-fuconolactonase
MITNKNWRIDSHHHYWDPSRGDYPWMPDSGPLRQTFLPKDHRKLNLDSGIGATIAVQAAPTLKETQWLYSQLQDKNSLVVGVVGWVDLENNNLEEELDSISHPLLLGIRPMIQDINDDSWILRPTVLKNLKLISKMGLTFDLLVKHHQLSRSFEALNSIPDLTVIIDHLAKPDYSSVDPMWLSSMRNFANRDKTFIKVSGLTTEVSQNWTSQTFIPHVESVFQLFGLEKVMLGTDWPVSTLAGSHAETCNLLEDLVKGLSKSEYLGAWRNNCIRAYKIPMPEISEF